VFRAKKNLLPELLPFIVNNEINGIDLQGKVIREVLKELSNNVELVSLSELGELPKGKGMPKSDIQVTGIPCIRYSDLAKVKVPRIGKNRQIEIAKKLESISANVFILASKNSNSKALQKSLINQIF
jgi:hypothetical protein